MKADSGRTGPPRTREIGIALLLLVGISAALYCFLFSDTSADKDKLTVEILQERHTSGDQEVDKSMVPSTGAQEEEISNEEDSMRLDEEIDPIDHSDVNHEEKEVNARPSGQKEFLVVHSFGVESNAKKFARKLEGHGYEVKTAVRSNGWTAVGVLFNPVVVDESGLLDALSMEYEAKPVRWEELESPQ